MKYWNKERVRRMRERERERQRKEYAARAIAAGIRRRREYTKGDAPKNADLMLHVLGVERHRRMLGRLRRNGAMSVSNLAKPFRITVPGAMYHVRELERAGLITTHKRGRIRFCAYNAAAIGELARWLSSKHPFDLS